MINIQVKVLGTVLIALATLNTHAAEPMEVGEGTLFKSLFGDSLSKNYGIEVSNLVDISYSRNNTSTGHERHDGLTNSPLAGVSDEGLELVMSHMFIDKALKSNIVPRITPLPGPSPTESAFGFTIEWVYGRNGQFARTAGWDAHWGINHPGASDPAKAARDRELFMALPNIAATAYLPFGPGITLMGGIFGPAMGYEVPPNVRAARNAFATKSYAFVTEPGTVSGVLVGTRLYSGEAGLVGAELGVVQGYNNLRDNNSQKSTLGALRFRTADMQTWVDYEFMVGDEQNDSAQDVQSALIASTGQLKQQHALSGWHKFDEQWSLGGEAVYGRQSGDGKDSTISIIRGPNFDGAHWWGANAVLTYRTRSDLAYSARLEHFADPDGYALFPVSTARGNFNALTVGLRYDWTKYLSLRPELRYDHFSGNADDHPFGSGRDRQQLTGTVEALFYF